MDLIRRRLLGLEGPYADARYAIDALDNVKLWVQSLDKQQKHDLLAELLVLLHDQDLEVATAAVLAMDFVADEFDSDLANRALEIDPAKLVRPPSSFQATVHNSILEEFFSRLCKYCCNVDKRILEDFLVNRTPLELRGSLYNFLAPNYSNLAVYHAHRLLIHDNVHVIVSLSHHWQRIATASAIRPYPTTAIDRTIKLLRLKNINANDIEAIAKVMSDNAPKLTHPTGLFDNRKWWIIASEPYRWTLWESDDNTTAIETHFSGFEYRSTSQILTEPEAINFRNHRFL